MHTTCKHMQDEEYGDNRLQLSNGGNNNHIETVPEDNDCSNGTQSFEAAHLLDRVSSTAEYYER